MTFSCKIKLNDCEVVMCEATARLSVLPAGVRLQSLIPSPASKKDWARSGHRGALAPDRFIVL